MGFVIGLYLLVRSQSVTGPSPPPERIARRRAADRAHRLRPGTGYGGTYYSPGMIGTAGATGRQRNAGERELDREIDVLARAVIRCSPRR